MKAHKMGWYKEWHQWRLSHHFHVAMLAIYIATVLFGSLGAFLSIAPKEALASTSYTWSFNTPSDYTYDPSKISFSGGIVQPSAPYTSLNVYTEGVYCVNALTCYIAGSSGKIFKTTDGGASWTAQTSGITNQLNNIYFADANTGYAVGSGGKIIKTTNGGTNWTTQTSGATQYLRGLYCLDANTCYTSGGGGQILKTTNGGTNWTTQTSGTTNGLPGIYCLDATNCYAAGYSGTILKTTNGGTSWIVSATGSYSLEWVHCTDINTCYIAGGNGVILKTTNGGTNWTSLSTGTTQYLDGIFFTDANTGFAVGWFGTILKTTNGGTSWTLQNTTYDLYSINCPTASTCYTGGYQYNLKTVNAGSSWIETNFDSTPTVIPNISQDYNIITGFKETLGTGSTGSIYYQISNDDGSTWYWYNGTAWEVAYDNTYRNSVTEINTQIPSFTGTYGGGTGKFKWKAIYYATSGTDSQKLDSVQISIKGNSLNSPQSLTISDVSNREKGVWALALSWDAPAPGGGTIDYFKIERSDNGGAWHETGRTSDGTKRAYAEVVDSSSTTYTYRVRAVDHDEIGGLYNDESEPSNEVSMMPTGKFPSLPSLIATPSVSVTATTANITWSTDRVSSSTVKYGNDTNYGLIASDYQTEVTSHGVSLKGLLPGTTYHYKIQSLDPERTYGDDVYYSGDYIFTTTLAAEISDLKVTEIRADNALLSWQTTSDMTSTVHYGKTTQYGSSVEASGGTSHTLRLNGLEDSTTYHLKIIGKDAGGNLVQSDDYSFETLAYPKISNVKFEPIKDRPTSTLRATWDTNIPTSSVFEYTDSEGKKKETAEYQMVTKHEIMVTGLKDNTEYIVVVKGRDAFGNEVSSESQKILTDIDTRPPGLSEITVEKSANGYGTNAKSQMIVSWSTDEPATSQVEYSKGGSGKNLDMVTQEDSSLSTSHAVIIPSLEPSSSYYFRIISKDSASNEAKSEIQSALTGRIRLSVFDIMLKSIASSFDWLFGARRLK